MIDKYEAPFRLYNAHKLTYWPKEIFNKQIAKATVDIIISISAGNTEIESKFAQVLEQDLKEAVENENLEFMN